MKDTDARVRHLVGTTAQWAAARETTELALALAGSSAPQTAGSQLPNAPSAPHQVETRLAAMHSILDFPNVKGDGVHDDWAGIQAALDWISAQTPTAPGATAGAGCLFFPPGKYRITKGLRLGWGANLLGVWAGGYPFLSPNTSTSQLYCDFGSNVNQWAIDSHTFHSAAGGGGPILHDEWVGDHIGGTDATGYTASHGISIRGLVIIDANNPQQTQVPFGAIRLVGCPNSRIDNISILGFGYAMALQCCFGTTIHNITARTNWYGFVAYNSNNAITLQGQFDKITFPASVPVPAASIPRWMPTAANMASTLWIDPSHAASAKGVIVAADASIGSNCATLDTLTQYWPDAVFLLNAYANTFTNLYAEGCPGFVLTTARASFNVLNSHNYSNPPLPYFADFGWSSVGKVNVGGNNTFRALWKHAFASGNAADLTSISFINAVNGGNVLLPANRRVSPEYEEGAWTPVVSATTGAISSVTGAAGFYTRTRSLVRAEFTFTIANNGTGGGLLQMDGLPYPAHGFTPNLCHMNAQLAQANIGANQKRITFSTITGTGYLGATGITCNGSVTYVV